MVSLPSYDSDVPERGSLQRTRIRMQTYISCAFVRHFRKTMIAILNHVVHVLAEFHPHTTCERKCTWNIFVDASCQGRDGRVRSGHNPVRRSLEDCDMFCDFGDFGQDLNSRAACSRSGSVRFPLVAEDINEVGTHHFPTAQFSSLPNRTTNPISPNV